MRAGISATASTHSTTPVDTSERGMPGCSPFGSWCDGQPTALLEGFDAESSLHIPVVDNHGLDTASYSP